MMSDVASYWPAWAAISVASIVLLNQAITESEKFANLLGRVGRSMYARSKRRYQMDQIEFSDAVRKAVSDERERWETEETRALTVVNNQMAYVIQVAESQKVELKELNFQLRCRTAYIEYEAEWHHKLRMALFRADANGLVNIEELPDHMHYADFERKCKENGNMTWRTWMT